MQRRPSQSGTRSRKELDAAVVELFRDWGRQGGKVGGKLRWKGVSAEKRRAHAKKAAAARWAKRK